MDQTAFSQNQPFIQQNAKPVTPPEQQLAEPKKPNRLLLIGIFVTVFVVIGLLVAIAVSKSGQGGTDVKATPTPSPAVTVSNREFKTKLEALEEVVNTSDPSEVEVKPPPLNLDLGI